MTSSRKGGDSETVASTDSFLEQRPHRFRRNRADRRFAKPLRITGDDEIASSHPRRRCGYGILKVGRRQVQGFPHGRFIDGGYAKDSQDTGDDPLGQSISLFFLYQVVNSRHGVSGEHSFRDTSLDRLPHCRARLRIRLPVQQHIQNDISIEEKFSHRYFVARCFLYSLMSAFLSTPRTERRTGVAPEARGGSATAAR